MAFAKMQKKKKTGKLWSKTVVRGTLVFFVFLKLSMKRKMHPYMFGNSLRMCDSTKYFESKWAFLGKKTIFSVRSRDI